MCVGAGLAWLYDKILNWTRERRADTWVRVWLRLVFIAISIRGLKGFCKLMEIYYARRQKCNFFCCFRCPWDTFRADEGFAPSWSSNSAFEPKLPDCWCGSEVFWQREYLIGIGKFSPSKRDNEAGGVDGPIEASRRAGFSCQSIAIKSYESKKLNAIDRSSWNPHNESLLRPI